jgi:hypothetical protein
MKFLMASLVLLLATAALAQTNNEAAKATGDPGLRPDLPKIDAVPPGGCMPIGLTARGDLVFPMQCREVLERQRGPLSEEQRPAPEQSPQSAPLEKPKQAVAPEQPSLPNKKISSVKPRKKSPPPQQVDPDFTGSTGKNDNPETSSTVSGPRLPTR